MQNRKIKIIKNEYNVSEKKVILFVGRLEPEKNVSLLIHSFGELKKLDNALGVIDADSGVPDILVVTLANNVTIKSEWIDECVNMMKQDMSLTAVVPVYEDNDHHPLRAKTVDENGRLQMYEKGITGKVSTNRQDLPTCYFLAHNFWVLNVSNLLKENAEGQQPWTFMGNNIAYYEIDESIDIHKEIDLYIAKEWIKENYVD